MGNPTRKALEKKARDLFKEIAEKKEELKDVNSQLYELDQAEVEEASVGVGAQMGEGGEE